MLIQEFSRLSKFLLQSAIPSFYDWSVIVDKNIANFRQVQKLLAIHVELAQSAYLCNESLFFRVSVYRMVQIADLINSGWIR